MTNTNLSATEEENKVIKLKRTGKVSRTFITLVVLLTSAIIFNILNNYFDWVNITLYKRG